MSCGLKHGELQGHLDPGPRCHWYTSPLTSARPSLDMTLALSARDQLPLALKGL